MQGFGEPRLLNLGNQVSTLKRFCCFSVRSQALQYARWPGFRLRRDAPKTTGPLFNSFQDITGPLLKNAANNLLSRLQTSADTETSLFDGFSSGKLPGIAPIPVPGFPGPQEVPQIPGVNTIPGLDSFNYLVGQLLPQSTAPKNLAQGIFQKIAPDAARLSVESMMGRWFQVITSPHVLREACAVSHFGALTNNTYSATFTILKFYREGNIDGPPRFSLGYGFKIGENGTFNIHNSNSPDTEPFTVVKVGPLNDHNQYDYAIVSNWVKFPVFVIARNPERFQRWYMREVLEYLEKEKYINFITKALNLIAPVDYAECQYTPTFSSAG
ncbi:3-ketoacyl-CoA thiolase [Trichinella spiralis]|uniref:3-ketoacyl-CoA thiolase n=1 Tax=Trichinella spiralis TaxID=6334 RepID=A0ABR3KRQ5_TRISP